MQAHFSNTSRSYLDFELRDETADFNQNRCSCQHDLPTPDYEYVNLPRDTSFHKYKQKTNQILVAPVGSLKISSSEFTLVAIPGTNLDTKNCGNSFRARTSGELLYQHKGLFQFEVPFSCTN